MIKKTKAKEMLIEFGKMKHIMSDWLRDTFNESPTWIKPKGRFNIINFVVERDDIKISMDVFVTEVVFKDNSYKYISGYYGMNRFIPEDQLVRISRVWMVITDKETGKRKQHDILNPLRWDDKNKLAYNVYDLKMQEYLSSDEGCKNLRRNLEDNSIWEVI